MTRDEVIDNLGTIARSGSQQFVKDMQAGLKENESSSAENIIG